MAAGGEGGDSSKEKYFVASHCAAGDVLIRYYLFLIWWNYCIVLGPSRPYFIFKALHNETRHRSVFQGFCSSCVSVKDGCTVSLFPWKETDLDVGLAKTFIVKHRHDSVPGECIHRAQRSILHQIKLYSRSWRDGGKFGTIHKYSKKKTKTQHHSFFPPKTYRIFYLKVYPGLKNKGLPQNCENIYFRRKIVCSAA